MNALQGKVAIITGADTELGASCALAASMEGAATLLLGENETALKAAEEMIDKAHGRCHLLISDLKTAASAEEMIDTAREKLGPPSVLITIPRECPGETPADKAPETLVKMLDKNLICCMNAMNAAIRAFGKNGGAVVNIASIAAFRGQRGAGPFSASMGAVASLSREAAVEHSENDVRVNCILSGIIKTDAYREIRSKKEPEYEKKLIRHIPQGRLGKPEEVAAVAVFLASDKASYITGAIIPVDGGYTAI